MKGNFRLLKFIFLFLVIFYTGDELQSQTKDPDEILTKVKEAFKIVKDYEVDIHIKVDVNFLKVPESDAKLYFKQPDKIHIESEKFVLLPKQGLNFSPLVLLNEKYTALYDREDTIRGVKTCVVKVIPIGNSSDVILSTLWIDQTRDLIIKIESSRKPVGTFSIDFTYEKYHDQYEMPSTMIFTFTVDRMRIPRGMNGQLDMEDETDSEKSGSREGKVYISYSNYKVNQDLSDELFENTEMDGKK
ncbi:MAG: hypothetical protein O6940_10285 [Ignavibacteria bacterium]|nr:hypothetical protein [Ignavibacteria bacterium]